MFISDLAYLHMFLRSEHRHSLVTNTTTKMDNKKSRMSVQSDHERDEDEERKLLAKEKEDHWRLLRLSIQYLKENEPKWRSRKIKECDRIREEEKADRLAIAKMKKKRYGVKGLSKEENGRMKQRTEERLEIARAK